MFLCLDSEVGWRISDILADKATWLLFQAIS